MNNMKYFVMIFVFELCCVMLESHGSPVETSVAKSRVRRIINGEPSFVSFYPHQVQIYENKDYIGGGSIISEFWIITAAQVVDDKKIENLYIRVGSTYLNRGVKYVLEICNVHENYDPNQKIFDIAVCKVTSEIQFTIDIKPIQLNDGTNTCVKYSIVRIIGHGHTVRGIGEITNELRESSMWCLPDDECNSQIAKENSKTKTKSVHETQMCIRYGQDKDKGFCDGDIGGSGVDENKTLVGICSIYFNPCGFKNTPQILTKVSYFIEWINEKTGIDTQST